MGSVIRTSPRSHRASVVEVTPTRAARSRCVSPIRRRSCRSCAPVMTVLYTVYTLVGKTL